ncbi:hypothetical protein Tco_1329529 [Tanacetum coccineum]
MVRIQVFPYPPGFTPDKSTNVINEKEVSDAAKVRSNSKSDGGNSRILEEVENIDGCFSSEGRNIGVKPKEGGSILEILDEMIKVGQTNGFLHRKNARRIWRILLDQKGGNYIFDHSFSEALGNSGGSLPGIVSKSLAVKELLVFLEFEECEGIPQKRTKIEDRQEVANGFALLAYSQNTDILYFVWNLPSRTFFMCTATGECLSAASTAAMSTVKTRMPLRISSMGPCIGGRSFEPDGHRLCCAFGYSDEDVLTGVGHDE